MNVIALHPSIEGSESGGRICGFMSSLNEGYIAAHVARPNSDLGVKDTTQTRASHIVPFEQTIATSRGGRLAQVMRFLDYHLAGSD